MPDIKLGDVISIGGISGYFRATEIIDSGGIVSTKLDGPFRDEKCTQRITLGDKIDDTPDAPRR